MSEVHHETDNLYAENTKGEVIFIENVESGRKGYFCLGCKKQMQAMKAHIEGRKSFFRHDPEFITKGETKCTYSDETYRHKLAKNILLREKAIKVPSVYKYAPKGVKGQAYKLRDSHVIVAHKVRQEVSFFENELGEVKFGHWPEEPKCLLVRPDIVFFDDEGNPILLIELVATHGLTDDKKIKLRRLGIDAIQVRIPKSAPEAIEEAIHSTDKIKWIYNAEEARTKYTPVSTGLPEGILPADEQQGRFFAESFICRQSQIKNLIRRVSAYLESEQYRASLRELTEEIGRVEANTEREKTELDTIRNRIRKAVNERFTEQKELIGKGTESLAREESEFREKIANLENRYHTKIEEIRTEQNVIDYELRYPGEGVRRRRDEHTTRRAGVKRKRGRVEQELADSEGKLVELEHQTVRFESEESSIEETIRRSTESAERAIADEIQRVERSKDELPAEFDKNEEDLRREFEEKEGGLPGEFEKDRKGLEERFEELRKQTHARVVSRNGQGDYELSRRIEGILKARAALNDYGEIKRTFDRVREAHEYYKSGAYQRRDI